MNFITLEHVNVTVGDFSLQDINMEIPQGCVIGLVGRNGSGKTTLIDTMAHVRALNSGTVTYKGQPFEVDSVGVRTWMGVVFDQPWFNASLTPKRLAKYAASFYPEFRMEFYRSTLERFGVALDKPVMTLSAGNKKKVMLVFVLACNPQLLILDEPTSEIDPVSRGELLDLLMDFMQDEHHSILFSTHITSDLDKIADYVAMIHEGKLVFYEEKDALISRYSKEHGVLPDIEDIMNYVVQEEV